MKLLYGESCIVGFKPILLSLRGPKNQSLLITPANHSRSRPIRYTCTSQRATTFRKFCAPSAKWGQNGGGLGWLPHSQVFLSTKQDDFLATSQRPIFTEFGHNTWIHVPWETSEGIFENVPCRDNFPPKLKRMKGSNSYLTQTILQRRGRTEERYCSLHVVV